MLRGVWGLGLEVPVLGVADRERVPPGDGPKHRAQQPPSPTCMHPALAGSAGQQPLQLVDADIRRQADRKSVV